MKKGEKIRAEKPKQYQQGWTEFYKLKFLVTEDTLIPRPETELLIDEILKITKQTINDKTIDHLTTIMDIGTGSGCIAISIAKNLPGIKILATDISERALDVARKNARFHKVDNKIFFQKRDLLADMRIAPDVIVTNLPYIPTARLLHIDPMVSDWEPKVALDGGKDGFELYRKLFHQIKNNNLYPKYLIGEIDYTQAEITTQETKKIFPNAKVEIKQDLAKQQRYFIIKF
jgi:release factor glutamine methyltransferase